jgi:hypothetical protein
VVSLYCYETPANLPATIHIKDARFILPIESTRYFRINGTPSLAHFTDYFRYIMFTRTNEIWIDTDLLLLKRFDLHEITYLAGKEAPDSVCNAILRLDSRDPRLTTPISRVEAMKENNINWGDTGPRLLTARRSVAACS